MTQIKVILPLGEVPDDSHVSKVSGTVKYLVKSTITIYDADGKNEVIQTQGCKFLINQDTGSINAMRSDTEVVWITDTENLRDAIDRLDGVDYSG